MACADCRETAGLDSVYPPDRDAAAPGAARGECGIETGEPRETWLNYPRAEVMFSNIKVGALNSTFG